MINKDTKVFFSAAKFPGNMGATLYNWAFKRFNLNAVYIPLMFHSKEELCNFICASRYSIHGMSLTMPFKDVINKKDIIDILSIDCQYVKNSNTLLFKNGYIEAHNTDVYGFEQCLRSFLMSRNIQTATIFGTGAVSKSIQYVLRKYNIHFGVYGRKDISYLKVGNSDLLINATPIGMNENYKDNIFSEEIIEKYFNIFDVVIGDTNLIRLAKTKNKPYCSGLGMYLHQFQKQFELYTGIETDIEFRLECEEVLNEQVF